MKINSEKSFAVLRNQTLYTFKKEVKTRSFQWGRKEVFLNTKSRFSIFHLQPARVTEQVLFSNPKLENYELSANTIVVSGGILVLV